jgi:hypothetical protein
VSVTPFPQRSPAFPGNTACHRYPVPLLLGNGERGTPPETPHGDEWTRTWATTAADLLDDQQSENTP